MYGAFYGYVAAQAIGQSVIQSGITANYYGLDKGVVGPWADRLRATPRRLARPAYLTVALAAALLLVGLRALELPALAGAYAYPAGAGATVQVWAHAFVPAGLGGLAFGLLALVLVGVRAEESLGRVAMVAVFFLGAVGAAAGADLAGGELVLTGCAGPVAALGIAAMVLGAARDWPACLLALALVGVSGAAPASVAGGAIGGGVGGLAILAGRGLRR